MHGCKGLTLHAVLCSQREVVEKDRILERKDEQITEKDAIIVQKDEEVADKDTQLARQQQVSKVTAHFFVLTHVTFSYFTV